MQNVRKTHKIVNLIQEKKQNGLCICRMINKSIIKFFRLKIVPTTNGDLDKWLA